MATPVPDIDPPGPLAPLLWGGIAIFLTCAGIGGLVLAIADSESAGVMATMIVSFPLGFVWAGAVSAIVLHFVKRVSTPARLGTPFGCGCLGGLALGTLSFLFFAAIFPEL